MSRHVRSRRARFALCPVLGILALAGCSGEATPRVPTSDDDSAPDASSAAPQHLFESSADLAPGRYQFSVATVPGAEPPDAVVDVPRGFRGGDVWYVISPDSDAFLGLWTVEKVERDACLRPRHDGVNPGRSVKALAHALVAQKSTRAAAPQDVTLAGSQGMYVELASPHDLSRCDPAPGLWESPGGRGIYSDDQVDRVWILDVDGQRLVVNAAYGPTATASERHKLTSMVETLQFVAAEPD